MTAIFEEEMKGLPLIMTLALCGVCWSGASAQSDWLEELIQYRDSIDIEFADPERSILPEDKLEEFSGLNYFEADSSWRVRVKAKKIKDPESFVMKTSTDRLPEYRPYASIKFRQGGKKCRLMVYQSLDLLKREEYKDYLFLPFTDQTNGEETYGGGRYLELSIADLETGWIDFNYAFNPYCAYNSRYSCPVPPAENDLDLRVNAGVQYDSLSKSEL